MNEPSGLQRLQETFRATHHVSGWMDRWEDVLALLDRKQYWRLELVFVDPRFANAMRMAIARRRLKRPRSRASSRCSICSTRGTCTG